MLVTARSTLGKLYTQASQAARPLISKASKLSTQAWELGQTPVNFSSLRKIGTFVGERVGEFGQTPVTAKGTKKLIATIAAKAPKSAKVFFIPTAVALSIISCSSDKPSTSPTATPSATPQTVLTCPDGYTLSQPAYSAIEPKCLGQNGDTKPPTQSTVTPADTTK